jgi:hypothetical protein
VDDGGARRPARVSSVLVHRFAAAFVDLATPTALDLVSG